MFRRSARTDCSTITFDWQESNTVTINIKHTPDPGQITGPTGPFCGSFTGELTAPAVPGAVYTWLEFRYPNWHPIGNTKNITVTTDGDESYRRRVYFPGCSSNSDETPSFSVNVNKDIVNPGEVLQPSPDPYCGSTYPSITIQATASSGSTGTRTYQWGKFDAVLDNDFVWLTGGLANNRDYTTQSQTRTLKYKRRVMVEGCDWHESNEVTLNLADDVNFTATPQDVSCNIDNTPESTNKNADGIIQLNNISGGTNHDITLSGPSVSQYLGGQFSDLLPGEYNVNVASSEGCTKSETVTVGIPDPIALAAGVETDIYLILSDNGIGDIDVDLTGGTQNYQLTLNQEGTQVASSTTSASWSFDDLSPGLYDLQVIDANLCEQTFLFRIHAYESPDFVLPDDVTISCSDDSSPNSTGTPTDPQVSTGCNTNTIITHLDIPELTSCNNTGYILRQWSIMDNCGGTTLDTQIITIQDNQPPTFDEPADVTISILDDTSAASLGMPTNIQDNCQNANFVISRQDIYDLADCGSGTITREWRVTDACGNQAFKTQLITVEDQTPPTFDVPQNITVSCGEENDLEVSGSPSNIADNCGLAENAINFSDSIVGPLTCGQGKIFRTWSVVDDAGNTASQTQEIIVDDTIGPYLEFERIITSSCDQIPQPILVDTNDNCSEVTIDFQYDSSGVSACNGTLLRIWMATDACGNETIDTQTIQLIDTVPPTFDVPADRMVSFGEDIELELIANVSDNCSIADTVYTIDSSQFSNWFTTGKLLRIWQVSDSCSNEQIDTQTLTIVPRECALKAKSVIGLPDCSGTGSSVDIEVDGHEGNPVSYLWSTQGPANGSTQQSLPNVESGYHTVEVSMLEGTCSHTIAFRVHSPPALSIEQVSANPNEVIISGGTAPYEIEWLEHTADPIHPPDLCKGLLQVTDSNNLRCTTKLPSCN